MVRRIGKHKVFIAVISHKRPENVTKILEVLDCDATFYVNKGEGKAYLAAGASSVQECGTNICEARNKATKDANAHKCHCIQVSDDLRSIKRVFFTGPLQPKRRVEVSKETFDNVVETLCIQLLAEDLFFGGVAVTTNRLNYVGKNFSYNLLVVNDLVCVRYTEQPILFDVNMYLKEDYDMTIRQLIGVGGLVRCNQFLCDFPHRDNKGGANTYRTSEAELEATKKLKAKWGSIIKDHPTRPGQIALNYKAIEKARQTFLS